MNPAQLDVERLAKAMEVTVDDIDLLPSLHAEEVAAEYARLSVHEHTWYTGALDPADPEVTICTACGAYK